MLALGILVVSAPLAGGQEAARQTLSFAFGTREPASSTGLHITIDYADPNDPAAKPPAVQTVVETLAPGASIDTSVPVQCTASDAELMAAGTSACPAGSVVGGGVVDLDSGIVGPLRHVHTTVVQFNNADELILLFEPEAGSGVLRSVARAPITEGGTVITAQAPPLPGGPPDGFTALKHVDLELQPLVVVRDGVPSAYITTPATCPPGGNWTSTVRFTYRDQVSQTATSNTECVPLAPRAADDATRDRSDSLPVLPITGGSEESRARAAGVTLAVALGLAGAHALIDRMLARMNGSASQPSFGRGAPPNGASADGTASADSRRYGALLDAAILSLVTQGGSGVVRRRC